MLPPRRSKPALPPAASRGRLRIALPSVALGVVFLGQAAVWGYASWRTGQAIDAWIAREAQYGRVWTCPDRAIGGFPFRVELSCAAPRFTGSVEGRTLSGSLGRILAVAQIYNPNQVIAEADGPLTMRDAAGPSLQLDWTVARASIAGRPAALERAAVEITNAVLQLTGLAAGGLDASADLVDFHIRRSPDRPTEERAYDVATRWSKAALPAFDAVLGGSDAVDLDLVATVTQAEPLVGAGLPSELERWRVAGGKLQIATLTLAKGSRQVMAKGGLALDEARRPQGRLEMTVSGLEDVLQSFGLGGRSSAFGGLLAGVLGGKPQAGETAAKPAGLTLPLRLENGRAFLGPLTVAQVPPLY